MLKNKAATKNQRDLTTLENDYRTLVKINPLSYNATRDHMKNISKTVQEMRRVRRLMGRVTPDGTEWLQEILSRVET